MISRPSKAYWLISTLKRITASLYEEFDVDIDLQPFGNEDGVVTLLNGGVLIFPYEYIGHDYLLSISGRCATEDDCSDLSEFYQSIHKRLRYPPEPMWESENNGRCTRSSPIPYKLLYIESTESRLYTYILQWMLKYMN